MSMQKPFTSQSTFLRAVPILVVNDIDRSLAFFQQIGFQLRYQEAGFAIVNRDEMDVHFTSNVNQKPEENWSVLRIVVTNIDALYQEVQFTNAIHPNGQLQNTGWGTREFSLIDPCGVLLTFTEPVSGGD